MPSIFDQAFNASGSTVVTTTNLTEYAHSFTSKQNQNLIKSGFYISKTGSPTGNITAKLYAHSGNYGTTSVPTGSALATSITALDISTLSTSVIYNEFIFTPYLLTKDSYYCIGLQYSGDNVNTLNIWSKFNPANGGHSGNASSNTSGVWTNDVRDLAFSLFNDNSLPGNISSYIKIGDGESRSEVAN